MSVRAEGSMLELLPDEKRDFSSQSFWDDFFVEWRKSQAEAGSSGGEEGFEWYGEWSDISPLVNQAREAQGGKRSSSGVLVLGCGNSTLSKDMYDEGYKHVTSIDFSSVVVEEMLQKYGDEATNPGLKFMLMDMLHMRSEWTQSFDMIVDKGALDALFAEDTKEMKEKAERMMQEVVRVLANGGLYILVTLAQPYLLSFVLDAFALSAGFSVKVSAFKPAESSALCPFLIVIHKRQDAHGDAGSGAELAFGDRAGLSRCALEESVQEQRMLFEMRRRVEGNGSGSGSKGVVGKFTFADGKSPEKGPRYLVSVVESGLGLDAQALRCGVFIVPQGREHEWMFANAQGQVQIAEGNGIGRLIVVALGRGHNFEGMEAIQKELSPRMLELAPADLPNDQPFPFFGVGQDVGMRKVVLEVDSAISGEIVVEDVKVAEKDEESEETKTHWHRRLVFLRSQHCIQSEVRLRHAASGRKKKKGQRKAMVVVRDFLAFEFHRAMVASLYLLPAYRKLKMASNDCKGLKIMLVGLGGGSLGSYLLATMPGVSLDVVELDPCLVEVAEKHFGFPSQATNENLNVLTEDGLSVLRADGLGRYDAVIIDVDSKDATGEVFAPAPGFLSQDFLQHLYDNVCSLGGGLILNMACTSEERKQSEAAKVTQVFANVVSISLEDDGDANAILTGIKADTPAASLVEAAKAVFTSQQEDSKGAPLREYIDECVVMERD